MRGRPPTGFAVDIESAIKAFFAATKGGQWQVSVADGVRRVRSQIGTTPISDIDLAELIKRHAAKHGFSVTEERKSGKSAGTARPHAAVQRPPRKEGE